MKSRILELNLHRLCTVSFFGALILFGGMLQASKSAPQLTNEDIVKSD